MEKINLHQQKLYALLEAGLALIALFLPWTVYKVGQVVDIYGMGGRGGGGGSNNGLRSWGFLVLLGIAGVVVASLLGDKTKEYDKNTKLIALGSFAAIALGAIMYFTRLNSVGGGFGQYGIRISSGIGLWLAFGAGIIGLAWVSGIFGKLSAKTTAASAAAAAAAPPRSSTSPPPPPPPPSA